MRVQLQLRIVGDDDTVISDDEVLRFDKTDDRLEAIGLSLDEAKTLLEQVQQRLVATQVATYMSRHRCCVACGGTLRSKGSGRIRFRTAFGIVPLPSPRFHCCGCQPMDAKTFSPLTALFTEHTAPELLYLETKWASLVSYGMTVDLLRDVLPIGALAHASTFRNHLHRVATRHDAELGDERSCFIEGCPADWKELPVPEGPIVVGIDGGYVRDWADKQSNFEVIVGKSMPEDRDDRYFGFVQTLDAKPRRRLFEVLRGQGFQMNQDITFLTDGGDDVRDLATDMSPCAEHCLDWFRAT
jgi:hypothetical protein